MNFLVGDIVRCTDKNSRDTGTTVKGLMNYQRFEVSKVTNYRDGSQSLWVVARPKNPRTNRTPPDPGERGPYSSVRFSLEGNPDGMFRYDPSQLGDMDDGI